MLRAIPLVNALDSDGSGSLEAAEIEAASTALATLDSDSSGALAESEFLPGRGRPWSRRARFPGAAAQVVSAKSQPSASSQTS